VGEFLKRRPQQDINSARVKRESDMGVIRQRDDVGALLFPPSPRDTSTVAVIATVCRRERCRCSVLYNSSSHCSPQSYLDAGNSFINSCPNKAQESISHRTRCDRRHVSVTSISRGRQVHVHPDSHQLPASQTSSQLRDAAARWPWIWRAE